MYTIYLTSLPVARHVQVGAKVSWHDLSVVERRESNYFYATLYSFEL